MNTQTTADTTDAKEIRAILEARKAEGKARAEDRRNRQEWLDRWLKNEAR